MEPLSGSPVPQAANVQPAVWYDFVVNHPLPVPVALPAIQMIATPTPSQTPTPDPSPSPVPASPQASVTVSMVSVKPKKVKPSPEKQVRSFCCEECGATFTSGSNLRNHLKIHSGVRPYVCTLCGKSFIQSSNLKAHFRVHTGERPYKCSECGQTFSRSSHLVGHKRTHTGERPYICGICGEAFYTSSHLRNHVRRHTGEKPYVCEHCGEAFSQSVELRVHVRYHTGEKPFRCRECDSQFVSARELRNHRKRAHFGSKPFNCEKCERSFRTSKFLTKHKLCCVGPRLKRPKGRPRKYPRADGEEAPGKKTQKPKYRKPAAPTDRVSRSKTRAMKKSLMKEENESQIYKKDVQNQEEMPSNENHGSDEAEKDKSSSVDQSPNIPESTPPPPPQPLPLPPLPVLENGCPLKRELQSESIPLTSDSPSKDEMLPEADMITLKHEVLSDDHISQLPMVQVMFDNLSSGTDGIVLHSLSSNTLHALQALSGQQEQLGVMDLSGQQIHDGENQSMDDVSASINILPNQQQHPVSTVVADQPLPVISGHQQTTLDRHQVTTTTVTGSHQLINGHQKFPVVSAHQNPVSTSQMSLPNSLVSSGCAASLPLATAAHQQAVTTLVGQLTSNQPTPNSQQLLANTVPAHQHLPSIGSTLHMQSPAVTAHQNLVVVPSHQSTPGSFHQQQLPVLSTNQNVLNVGIQQQSNTVTTNLENTVTAHQNMTVASAHQQMTIAASGHQPLPVVSAHQNHLPIVSAQNFNTNTHSQLSPETIQLHPVNCHQEPSITSAHQQTDVNHQQPLPSLNVRHPLPSVITTNQGGSSLHQQHQQLVADMTHKHVSPVAQQQQFPIVSAHQQITSTGSQQVTAAHQANGAAVACENLQQQVLPLMSVYKQSSSLGNAENTSSQVVCEGGQTFVVDLSSPALSSQVSLVNQTISNAYTKQ